MGCKMIIHNAVIIAAATIVTSMNFTVPVKVTLLETTEALCVCVHTQRFTLFLFFFFPVNTAKTTYK